MRYDVVSNKCVSHAWVTIALVRVSTRVVCVGVRDVHAGVYVCMSSMPEAAEFRQKARAGHKDVDVLRHCVHGRALGHHCCSCFVRPVYAKVMLVEAHVCMSATQAVPPDAWERKPWRRTSSTQLLLAPPQIAMLRCRRNTARGHQPSLIDRPVQLLDAFSRDHQHSWCWFGRMRPL